MIFWILASFIFGFILFLFSLYILFALAIIILGVIEEIISNR